MKTELISKMLKLIEEYEWEYSKNVGIDVFMSGYYEGKAEGLSVAIRLISEIE